VLTAKTEPPPPPSWDLELVKKIHVLLCLDAHQGNMVATARALKVGKTSLYRWLKNWGVSW
jgi:transcriptional regulator of acetoin/glycerol metabolism